MSPPPDATNAAWVEAEIPLSPPALFEFLAASERLWRLNPCLAIAAWQVDGEAAFSLRADNEANGRRIDTRVRREALPGRGFRFTYAAGLKQSSEFIVSARGDGSLLTVTERYAAVDGPDDPRAGESDTTLLPWIVAVRAHLVARARWDRLPGWRWWHERFMLSMPPRQRRIVRMIIWLTAIEFVVFLALVLILRVAA
jgi:hypothetical protein